MKSLLVTTELFNIGGLETHVAGEVACLAEEGFRIHLVVGPNTSDKMLPKEATSVTTGLVMGPAMTTAELIQTVESLRKIIRANGVECVHAHPFMSLVPSQIAAELEGIPFVVTLHGPASLSDCYGPLYDFILSSVILPKSDMVVAVSQEVADLAAPYVDDARLCVLPNGVPKGNFCDDPAEDCADGRWLLVSRLDTHKVVGIRDFIQKAAAAGLPGVLIVGDGDGRGKLLSQLYGDGLSNYVEFLGARTDVAKLMRRAAGVAGMGRVILEGLSCGKPTVLVGYDGVKGVVTPDVFRAASATNFSGRKMPTISATEFSCQLSLTQRGTNELTDLVRSEYSDKAIWRKFAQKLGGLKTHGRSLLSDAYIKFASETNAPAEAYLHSHAWFEQVGRLAHSLKHFDQSVVANFYYTQKRYMDDRMVMQIASLNQAVAERDGQITCLNQAVVERDGQIASLNQAVAERDGQITSLNQAVAERDGQIASLNHAVAERDGQIASLNQAVAERDGQITCLNQAVVERDGQIASLNQAVAERDGQITSLNQAVAERDGQIASLNHAVAERDGQIASLNHAVVERDGQIASLNHAVTERDGQIASLNQAVVERDHQLAHFRDEAHSLFIRLNQLLHSHSWQLTRPMRAAARIVKHGHPFADGNRAIYDMAARIGRKFPFPLSLKANVRRALLERIYPDDAPVLVRKDAIDQIPSNVSEYVDGSRTFIRPECCGLIEGLVSVVLPVYNQANLIEESIESVLNQTYQSFELIIINDGSSDGVEAVLERYIDHPKVRCFTQANQRLPKALSNGFSFARGEFWTWTSADNIMEPRMLEMLVGKLRAEPDLGMTFADYYAIDDRGNLLQDPTWRAHNRPNPASGEIRLPRTTEMLNIVQDNFIGPCFMYRGWIGLCLGDYDPQLGIEDYDYWMRINAFFPIRHLGDDSLLYRYRVHDNTLSAKAHEHKILEKAQRLMAYEKERAAFYEKPLAYVADSSGRSWLQAHGILDAAINSFENDVDTTALAVISSECAEKNISELLRSGRPVAIIIDRTNTRYHKLVRLLSGGSCIALACDKESADRVKLVSSTCVVVDANSAVAINALEAFAKSLFFIRATRTVEELKREVPRLISVKSSRHVVLQVDSFTQGGMENVVIDLALSLENNGYRVTIANYGKSGDAAEKAKEGGLKVASLSDNLSEEAYRSWLIEERVDLVNAHYSIRGADVCFSVGIPFIQTIHNSYVWLDPVQIEKYRTADQYTDQYICVSMTAARYADVVLGLDVSKMQVVPNGIDPDAIDAENFEINRTSLRRAWGVEDTALVYLNVASIMATKAQLPLVKAFAQVVEKIPHARLVLLGAVMEAPYQAAIERAVRELGLQEHVIFAGYDRQVSRYYHASDVFVLPSYWEGWSLSLGEAMANGLSCVITDVGSAYEFETFDNVVVIEPPFGDISQLNYKNLGDFVYGEDAVFENRLAEAMVKVSRTRKSGVSFSIAEQIDRGRAYASYVDMFAEVAKKRNVCKTKI